jgi:hypothetical protein
MGIDLSQSWMIGNAYHDTTAGKRVGCRTILLNLPPGAVKTPKPTDPSPDFKAVNLKEAANIIKRYSQAPQQPPPPTIERPPEPMPQPKIPEPEPAKKPIEIQEQTSVYGDRVEQLLENIIKLLRTSQREEMFPEFSMSKLIAGLLQGAVILCLLIGLYFFMNTSRNTDAIFISLGFAIVFQLMTLTFYIIQGRK